MIEYENKTPEHRATIRQPSGLTGVHTEDPLFANTANDGAPDRVESSTRRGPIARFGRRFDPAGVLGYDSFAGWSSLVARRAHNPEVVGSNPTPATTPFFLIFRLLPTDGQSHTISQGMPGRRKSSVRWRKREPN